MGYRALLKQYIRHLMRVTGDHHILTAEPGGVLGRRDVAELRLLAAEIGREDEAQARSLRQGFAEDSGQSTQTPAAWADGAASVDANPRGF
jgi:hypothetical protein